MIIQEHPLAEMVLDHLVVDQKAVAVKIIIEFIMNKIKLIIIVLYIIIGFINIFRYIVSIPLFIKYEIDDNIECSYLSDKVYQYFLCDFLFFLFFWLFGLVLLIYISKWKSK